MKTTDIPQLLQVVNSILTTDFAEKEVYEAIIQMENNKAPGQDGFPSEFYQTSWEIIKHEMIKMLAKFQRGNYHSFSSTLWHCYFTT
jgi:hypothetical protein